MKFVNGFSLLLALLFVCSVFFACDSSSKGDENVDLPEREFYEVTVSFQIKDSSGKTIIDAKDYVYKGHPEPTILNVLDTYLAVVRNWVCKIKVDEERGTKQITQIGGMKVDAKNGEYWGIVTNVINKENADGTLSATVKEGVSALNLSLEDINKQMNEDDSMDKVLLTDGAEFTVIQVVSED